MTTLQFLCTLTLGRSHVMMPRLSCLLRVMFLTSSLLLFALANPAVGQLLTRVTDPTNPIVTDAANSGGVSWIDLDDDGDLELFVANGNLVNQNEALYWNAGGGEFLRTTTGPVVTDGGSSIGGTFGDYDNDGHHDLFVTNRNNFGNFLYHADGDTLFTKITTGSPVEDIANSNSSSWSDLDRDGDLDLYVVNFAAADFLYENVGAPTFELIPVEDAAPLPGTGPSIPGAWADFDNDRDQDLFLGVAGTANDILWRNDGAFEFTAIPFSDGRATLGGSWGDFDNDGDLDLIATSFLNQRSILYVNGGPPSYPLVPNTVSILSNTPANAVGSGWGDYDNDGDLDLFIATDSQNNLLFENGGPPNYTFTRITNGSAVNDGGSSFGCVWGDYDEDGALDLVVANQQNQVNFLYHNEGNDNSWITVRCVGTLSNRSGIGARVRIKAVIDGIPIWQTQEVVAQSGYNAQNLDLHFGLGVTAQVDSLVVEWPSGDDDVVTDVAPDQLMRVVQGDSPAAVLDPYGSEVELNVIAGRRLSYSIPEAGRVQIALFDVSGRLVLRLPSGLMEAGRHEVSLEPSRFQAGLFFCRFLFEGRRGQALRRARVLPMP